MQKITNLRSIRLKNNFDITKNDLMSGLLTRQLLTDVVKNTSFDLKKGIAGPDFIPSGDISQGALPTQIASLMVSPTFTGSPFLDFSQNQGYIDNFVINPSLLSEYWFKHQNIVKVEYLSGFVTSTEQKFLKSNDNPYIPLEVVEIEERNVSKPVWELLTSDVLSAASAEQGILCRLVRYDDANYINRHIVNKLDMPLINSYFIITN